MKLKIIIITLVVVIGLPTVALGSSFVTSIIKGQTSSEAITTIKDQIKMVFNKNSDQESILKRIESLESDNKIAKENTEKIEASQLCDRLLRDVPSKNGYDNWGDVSTVIKFYNRSKYLLESGVAYKEVTENQLMIAKSINELKSKYNSYVNNCGGKAFNITFPSVSITLCNELDSKVNTLEKQLDALEQEYQEARKLLSVSKNGDDINSYKEFRSALDSKTEELNKLKIEIEKIEEQRQSNICGFK